ncbi:MAG: Hydrolase 4 protein [Patescibacteria group bacterium]|nr:Hydrolase 4 protein [Patescibacteria group bacterium]
MANKIKKILKTAKSVLFADPKRLYEKERDLINKPFYFQGTNGKAVLLVHGWTSVPYEVRRLGQYLNENGYTAHGPMLSGHGTIPSDLERVDWKDWLRDITQSYEELKKNHSKVYIAGTSIGACLAVILAKNKADVAGLVLMAMPYKIRFERIALALAKFINYFKRYNQKYYPPTFGARTTITRLIAYQSYPIQSALETFELVKVCRKELPKAVQPCFIIQSLSDHVVAKKSLEIIYGKIGSKVKKKKYIRRAYHTFISDIKNEEVFEDILNFINEN